MVKDNLNGVSSNIMLGQTIPSGTGFTDILLDEELMNNLVSLQSIEDRYINPDDYDVEAVATCR